MYFAELISFGCSSASFISQPTHRLSSLPQAVPLLGLHTSTTAPRACRPLGPLTPPVCSDICTLLQAVGGLRQVLSYHKGHIAHDKKGQGSPQPGPHTDRDAAPPPPEHLHPAYRPARRRGGYGRTNAVRTGTAGTPRAGRCSGGGIGTGRRGAAEQRQPLPPTSKRCRAPGSQRGGAAVAPPSPRRPLL